VIRSAEVGNLILQWYASLSSGEVVESMESLLSGQKGFVMIGTDPTEWWEASEEVIRGYRASANRGKYKIRVDEILAYSEGTVSWVVDRTWYTFPNGNEVPVRHTIVLHREGGGWKIVHIHGSIGMPNEAIGYASA